MPARLSRLAPLSLLPLALACSAQEGPDFVGRPVWKVQGSLTSETPVARDTATALVWDADFDRKRIVTETDVQGDFPAEFTLLSYEAPPPEALISSEVYGQPLKLGFATIAAVDAAITPFFPEIYLDGQPEEGDDPEAVHGDYEWLRGGVANYLVVYVDAEEDPRIACLDSLSRGYNMLELRDYTEAEVQADELCRAAAFEDYLADYNAEHGTAFTVEQVLEDAELYEQLELGADIAACAAGCSWLTKVHARVVPADERVTMTLDPALEFVDWH